ncbi:MAG: Gfo/Idh/MocA family oxidoreductase [Burkholderiales bacterium]|nr:Gfo/Idh/MocA family oxidoreductase [Burkholderiales bacterium]MCZ2420982.1 Gfo/Idh/MocA family oxidoreductase [Burkholderiales bacterium]
MSTHFLLVGTGRMGLAHLRAARNLGLEPVGLCDQNSENLAKAAAEAGVDASACFGNSSALFAANPGTDLVLIATTADSHRTLVEQAAAAGARAVLCEKPMATSVADCDAMIAACERSGTRLAVNHQMRFMDQYSRIKGELDSGRFGPLASMNVVAGCFGLSMNGSHYCEALRWLCGSDIVSATAWFAPGALKNPRGPQFSDQAGEMRFETADGRRLMMSIGADQGHGMTVTYAARYGHIFVDELEGVYYATARKPEHRDMPVTRYGMPWDRWEVRFPQADNVGPTQAVIEALLKGKDYPDGRSGRNAVAALAAAWRSAEQGSGMVRVDDLGEYANKRFPWA